MAYMLQIGESAIHRNFVECVFFMKTVFSCLNLKPDDRFLCYSMLEVFKTRHGLADIYNCLN